MKNTLRSILSVSFALLILLSLIPLHAFAAGGEITSIVLIRENYTVGTTTDSWVIGIVYFIPLPQGADDSGVRLYYADTDLPVERNADSRYVIDEPGEYRAYYMDGITGVKSEEFTLVVKSAEAPDSPPTSDRIFAPIIFALLALVSAYSAWKARKYE